MTRPRVLVSTRSYSTGSLDLVARLEQAGADVVRVDVNHDIDTLGDNLAEASAWIAGAAPITADHLDRSHNLRLIARYGVGTDAVDLAAAQERGILVTNTPGANSDAVAEHALALLLAALRRVVAGNHGVRTGDWSVQRATELRNLKVGVVGFGRIGQSFADRLTRLACTVFAVDPALSAAQITQAGARPADWDGLASYVDVVSLHAPGEQQIVDSTWLTTAADGLVLLNTARAALVDEVAVAASLRADRLGVYAADDISTHAETTASGGINPLLSPDLVDKVILTPHSGAQTIESVDNMGAAATEAVLAVLAGREPRNLVHPR